MSSFTLQDLENSGADVVIVSDPAGGLKQWSPSEVLALQAYAQQGHNLIGTFLVFQWLSNDNRLLAPLWGLSSTIGYNWQFVYSASALPLLAPTHCLFDGIQDPFDLYLLHARIPDRRGVREHPVALRCDRLRSPCPNVRELGHVGDSQAALPLAHMQSEGRC